jgi:hypothetical protein
MAAVAVVDFVLFISRKELLVLGTAATTAPLAVFVAFSGACIALLQVAQHPVTVLRTGNIRIASVDDEVANEWSDQTAIKIITQGSAS